MNAEKKVEMNELLRQSLPPVNQDAAPQRDLWPAMSKQIRASVERPAAPALSGWALFDGALLAGLMGMVAIFPISIPLLLYYF